MPPRRCWPNAPQEISPPVKLPRYPAIGEFESPMEAAISAQKNLGQCGSQPRFLFLLRRLAASLRNSAYTFLRDRPTLSTTFLTSASDNRNFLATRCIS